MFTNRTNVSKKDFFKITYFNSQILKFEPSGTTFLR